MEFCIFSLLKVQKLEFHIKHLWQKYYIVALSLTLTKHHKKKSTNKMVAIHISLILAWSTCIFCIFVHIKWFLSFNNFFTFYLFLNNLELASLKSLSISFSSCTFVEIIVCKFSILLNITSKIDLSLDLAMSSSSYHWKKSKLSSYTKTPQIAFK